ncbi:MAG TPA: hypothetical protein VGG20_05615 [Thermoanaerobaculia bacterium]
MRNRTILILLGLSLLLGFAPLSAATVIQHGIDVFTTSDNGKTFYDFSYTPIPAGFFCAGSKAFTGKVALKGLPIATEPAGLLGSADTIVERLDNAAFDKKGIATTRIQFRALSLVSSAPIKTSCGDFHVYVTLAGKQRVTTMSIFRTQEGGGDFAAPLAVDGRMTFIPVKPPTGKSARKLELTQSFTFPGNRLPWSLVAADAPAKKLSVVKVDTNGDLIPDTLLPGTSNFSAGQLPEFFLAKQACSCCPTQSCHTLSGQYHCVAGPSCPGVPSCC